MLLAFKHRRTNPIAANLLIELWTRSPWVHVEVLVESGRQFAVAARTQYDGVHALPYSAVLKGYPDGWECYRVPLWDETEQEAKKWLLAQTCMTFNFPNVILSQGYGIGVSNLSEWFCSEIAYTMLRQYSSLETPDVQAYNMSPGRLRQFCIDQGCEQVTLHPTQYL